MSWRIKTWDPVRAQGTIASALGELPFDAAVAMVDRFEPGEAVEVVLEPAGSSYRVRRIAPVLWRVPPSPPFSERIERGVIAEACEALLDQHQSLEVRGDGEVRLHVVARPYEPAVALVLTGASFLQMALEPSFARLAVFELAAFARISALPEGWGLAPDARDLVFRFEPEAFGEAAGYVVAQHLRLERAPPPAG